MEPSDRLGVTANGPELMARLRAGLGKLLRAYSYAREAGQDPWDFAVEIQDLRAEGLDSSDFRWLVCKGYVLHAGEVIAPAEDRREFQPTGRLRFCKRTCFVLTPAGVGYAAQILTHEPGNAPGRCPAAPAAVAHAAGPHDLRPRWNRDRQELCVGRVLVKRFKVPAPNQEVILGAFEEEGWPARIDDPIPPQAGVDRRRRLHDTINSLNGCHLHALIRFLGDGSGQGVRWEALTPPPSPDGCLD